MFRIQFGIFLGFITILCGCEEFSAPKNNVGNTSPPPAKTTITTTDKSSITIRGLMTIRDKNFYTLILETSRICSTGNFNSIGTFVSVNTGATRCSAWMGSPLVTITFNQNLDKVQSFSLTPRGSKSFTRNFEGAPINIELNNRDVLTINDGDGWEIRLLGGQGIAQFDLRVRCEDCDLQNKEFDDVDIYFGPDLNKRLGDVPSFVIQGSVSST